MSDKDAEIVAKIKKKYNLGGRPTAFKDPEELLEKIYDFLYECEARTIEVAGKDCVLTVKSPAPTTLGDFCVFAGIGKTTFYDYGKKKKFAHIVRQYDEIVEAYWERQCAEGRPGNKADFVLKNMYKERWNEKVEGDTNVNVNIEDRRISDVNGLIAEAVAKTKEGHNQDSGEE